MITIISIIFCPDESNFLRFKNSLQFIILSDLSNVDKIIFDGWIPNDNIYNEIKKIIDNININNIKIIFNRRIQNVGKSTIINQNIQNINTELVLCLDSDIILFSNTIQQLKSFINFYDIVIPEQLEDCRHYKLLFNNYEICLDELVYVPNNPEGIAGGAIMLKTKILNDIKFNNKGPYGSDDVEFLENAIKKFSICVCSKTSIIHPINYNINYDEWKSKMSLSGYHINLTEEEINNRIKNSIKLWNF